MSDPELVKDNDTQSKSDEHIIVRTGEIINASGHVQELDRNFSLLSICSVGICTGNTWASLGGK
jgi:choline transport protein